MSAPQAEFFEIFRDEANERLDRIVDVLLGFEKGEGGADEVDALFRETHTLKGAAGMLGLEEIRAVAHGMEDMLASVRGSDDFPVELTDPLLRAADSLRAQVGGHDAAAEEAAEPPAQAAKPKPSIDPRPAGESRSIRVPAEKIDALLDLVGETVLHRRRLEHAVEGRVAGSDDAVSDELLQGGRLVDGLKDAAIAMRTLPLASIIGQFPRAVRDLAAESGKEVELVIDGAETELDRVILEALADPLVHLMRNSIAHGIEPPEERERIGKPRAGKLELRAAQRGRLVVIVVADDGRGVPPEALEEARDTSLTEVLSRPGFSTAGEVSDLAGRGVGLDAVKAHVESFGGSLEVRSDPGSGTEVCLLLPLALALVEALLVEQAGDVYGFPLAGVEEAIAVTETLSLGGRPALELRGATIPLSNLGALTGGAASPLRDRSPAVVVTAGGRKVAVACDSLLGKEEVVVKSLGPFLTGNSTYLGASILGDGRIALLLDPAELVRSPAETIPAAPGALESPSPAVLVVEDSFTVRELQRSILEAAGYEVETARSGKEALKRLSAEARIGLVLTDVEMPELDGIALTEAIRELPERAHLPVVVVTSRGAEEDRQRGIEAGADAYMVKREFDQQELLETVERLIGR